MRASGTPHLVSRRALCKAVHLSPSSVRSWSRLSAISAYSLLEADRSFDEQTVSSQLVRTSFAVAERLCIFSLSGNTRDAGGGARSTGHGHATVAGLELYAEEVASSLCGLGITALYGGGSGSSGTAVGAASRAVHMFPGESHAWRCLGAALVRFILSLWCPSLGISLNAASFAVFARMKRANGRLRRSILIWHS